MSEVIYRKYRPSTFADVTDQAHVKTTVQNQIASGNVAHAYLFTGPRGVGKTTIARLIAKAVNCEKRKNSEPCNKCSSCEEIAGGASLDVVEIDAASHTDVENVRENIIKSVRFTPNRMKFKVYIIDEVHMLSTSSFNALLKTLEEPPQHAIFILATTEIHKVPETIISRCQRFDFKRVPTKEMMKRLQMIAKGEKIQVSEDVLQEIARHSDGCMRDAESLFGQILALGEKTISMEEASLVLPATTTILVIDFLEAISEQDAKKAVTLINAYVEQGVEMSHFLDDVIDMLRNGLLAQLGDENALSDAYDAQTASRVESVTAGIGTNKLTQIIDTFLQSRRSSKLDKIPQLSIELAVIHVIDQADFQQQGVDSSRPNTDSSTDSAPKVQAVQDQKEEQMNADESTVQIVSDDEKTDAIQAEAKVFDSVPVLSLEEVKKKWPKVFQELQETNASLPLVVQSGELTEVNGDELEIGFAFELHAEVLNKEKNRKIMEGIMKNVFGKPLRVRGIYQNVKDDEAVSSLLEEFGGSVV